MTDAQQPPDCPFLSGQLSENEQYPENNILCIPTHYSFGTGIDYYLAKAYENKEQPKCNFYISRAVLYI